MSSRNRRPSKVVDYCALQNGSSDEDDFADFTPPTKKKKETKRDTESDKENQTKVPEDAVKTSKKRSPTQRLSIEERKFKRDMEIALELSSKNECSTEDFQGFNKENDADDHPTEVQSCLVIEAEIHATPSDEPAKKLQADAVLEERETKAVAVGTNGLHSEDQQIVPCPLRGVEQPPPKRHKKKVNFAKDDDSDDWDSSEEEEEEEEEFECAESDESDFFPSPKKKSKKETKLTKPKEPKTKAKSASQRKPPKVKHDLPLETPALVAPRSPVLKASNKPPTSSPSLTPKPSSPKPAKRIDPSTKSTTSHATVPKNVISTPKSTSSSSKIGVGLVKKAFKSPSIGGSSPSPTSSRLPPSTSGGGIGLRLGLSRRVYAKPLHPNASSVK